MKTTDVLIVGGGVIGLSLACDLRRHGQSVIVLERHQPGREASWAAGGMLAACEAGTNQPFRVLAKRSAAMYPAFAAQLKDESGVDVDLRGDGKIRFVTADEDHSNLEGEPLTESDLAKLEPQLAYRGEARFLLERSVDPRALMDALLKAAIHLGVTVASGAEVTQVVTTADHAKGVETTKTSYFAPVVVNCGGAWAGQISPIAIPTRPIKGHMLCVVHRPALISHVIQANGVYLIPRTDGRITIGSTVEDVGFDKRVNPDTIQRLHQSAANLVPQIGEARIHDDWCGLRPGTPDKLPILGETSIGGYLVATGHYRDGILLAPVTATMMSQMIRGEKPEVEIEEFSPARFPQ